MFEFQFVVLREGRDDDGRLETIGLRVRTSLDSTCLEVTHVLPDSLVNEENSYRVNMSFAAGLEELEMHNAGRLCP